MVTISFVVQKNWEQPDQTPNPLVTCSAKADKMVWNFGNRNLQCINNITIFIRHINIMFISTLELTQDKIYLINYLSFILFQFFSNSLKARLLCFYFQELLIETIKKYPSLWNIKDKNYRNRVERNSDWTKVLVEIGRC